MGKVEYYEAELLCCNPFELESHKAVKTCLRSVTQHNLALLHSRGIEWVTDKMKVCINCRFRFTNVSEQENPVTASTEKRFEEQISPPTSSVSSKETPSTGESVGSLVNFEKNQALTKFLGISIDEKTTRLDASSSNYRVSTSTEIFSQIFKTIRSWFPKEVSDVSEDINSLLLNLKSAFSKADTVEKKIEVLRLLPRSWSYLKIKSYFEEATQHMITEAKKCDLGIQPLLKTGRPSHGSEVQDNVINFYLRDDISRPFPGLKDTISIKLSNGIRQNFQKRLLLAPLDTLYKQYLELCKNVKQESVSFTSFWKLRPKQCVYTNDSSAMNVCVCMIHENMKFMFDALNKTDCFKNLHTDSNLNTFLLNKVLCEDSKETCYLRSCEECNSRNMIDFVSEYLDEHNIDIIKYSFWIISPRCEIIHKEDNVNDFLENLQAHIEKFVVHQFKVEQQTKFIRMKKESLINKKEIMCQMDFAENYSCITQDSIQSHYFVRPQVTIHPFVVYYNDGSSIKVLNYIVIADIKKHNTISVYAFQKKMLSKLKDKFPELEKIIYLSDGCAEQYKNKSNFKNVCCHEKDFNIKAEWHFFPTSHGKGPCDGNGGTIKRMAKDACIRKTAEINSAKQFYDWATSQEVKHQFKKDWEFIYATDTDYTDAEIMLKERFDDLVPIPGTKKYHAFIPKDERSIYASEYSDQSGNLENKVCFPLDKTMKRKSSTSMNPRRSSRLKK
jgi:hypothetical protein